ncbi:hypothetical protein AB1Y20_018759 [Prymnesium parvum]|uniref:Uncharacterized protein n=1 Tax=Prymnesium parvum TaxID=97485 RepID=A0AB34JSN3_PRYPA
MAADRHAAPRAFPTSPSAVSSAHSEWCRAAWEDAGFSASRSVHIVALKPLLARVFHDGGEPAPIRAAADTITSELQQGRRHWELRDFSQWCTDWEASRRLGRQGSEGVLRERRQLKPLQSRRPSSRELAASTGDLFSIGQVGKEPMWMIASKWAEEELNDCLASVAPLSSGEARLQRVAHMRSSVSNHGADAKEEDGGPLLLDENTRRANIEQAVQQHLRRQNEEERSRAAKLASDTSQAVAQAAAHARALRLQAMSGSSTSSVDSTKKMETEQVTWQQPYWDALQKALADAQALGTKRAQEPLKNR